MSRPIALAGFMGVGKTTLGILLAERLGWPFHDTDAEVERASGRTIDEFFASGEEPEFRRREAEVLTELVRQGPAVIALGGGALLDELSRSLLGERTLLVHLDVPWEELRDRMPNLMATRPLLRARTLEEIHRLFLLRQQTYGMAPVRVTLRRGTPDEAADQLLAALRDSGRGSSDDPFSSAC